MDNLGLKWIPKHVGWGLMSLIWLGLIGNWNLLATQPSTNYPTTIPNAILFLLSTRSLL